MNVLTSPSATTHRRFVLQLEVDYWYQYVSSGLRNEIKHHTRKDQRTYRRHFCNQYSKLQRFKEQYPEYLL